MRKDFKFPSHPSNVLPSKSEMGLKVYAAEGQGVMNEKMIQHAVAAKMIVLRENFLIGMFRME